jgi:hypothetical protein
MVEDGGKADNQNVSPVQPPAPAPAPAPVPVPSVPVPGPVVNGGTCSSGCASTSPGGCFNFLHNHCGTWTASIGAYYMVPVFESNPAYVTLNGTAFGTQSFNHDFEVAPLATLGYTGLNGWGVRGRVFTFDGDGTNTSSPSVGTTIIPAGPSLGTVLGAGDAVVASSNLSLDVYDFEATYTWSNGPWSWLASAGARYVDLSQDYNLSIVSGGVATNTVTGTSSFKGAGPTFSFEARRQLANPALALYGTVRGSILFGSGEQTSATSGAGFGAFTTTANQTDVLSIGEMEIGGEWGKDFGRYRLFTQLGFVGQVWFGGGNAAQGPNGTDLGQNFGFYGGVARIGLNF